MMRRLALVCGGIASLSLLAAFWSMGHWVFTLVIVLVEFFWWLGWHRKLNFISYVYLVVNLGLCVLGAWVELSRWWLLAAAVTTLAAWDLDRFDHWQRHIDRVEMKASLIRRHLLRLLLVCATGLILGGAALVVRVQLDFAWILILGLLTVVGLSQIYNLIKREVERR